MFACVSVCSCLCVFLCVCVRLELSTCLCVLFVVYCVVLHGSCVFLSFDVSVCVRACCLIVFVCLVRRVLCSVVWFVCALWC